MLESSTTIVELSLSLVLSIFASFILKLCFFFLQFLCLSYELCCFHCQIFFFISGFILCLCAYVCLVIKLCPTLCQRMDCSPLGSSVHGNSPGKNTKVCYHALLQGSSQPRDRAQVSRIAGGFFTI